MTGLGASFRDREAFRPSERYRLLPARFTRLDNDRYVITNDVGEYVTLPRDALVALIQHRLSPVSA
jgi:uncharacterized protein